MQKLKEDTGCSINIVFFFLKCHEFSELCQFYLPSGDPSLKSGVYAHLLWGGKTERGQSPDIFQNLRKNTIFNEHPEHEKKENTKKNKMKKKDTSKYFDESMEVQLPALIGNYGTPTDQPTTQPTEQPTDGHEEALESYTSNN